MDIQENWKEFYKGYFINEKGIVWSEKSKKIRKTSIDKYGYEYLTITDNGTKKFMVHRLVAQYFIPKPKDKNCVNHKDGNKLNNSVENLEWCTIKENNLHAYKVLGKKACGGVKPTKVISVSINTNEVKEYNSQREAARITGVDQSRIYLCCNNKAKTAGGYIWKYKKEEVL